MTDGLKNRARPIKQDVHALYLASRDPRVPWYAKAMALVVAGYALSPIDLIPDFIPVLGYLDDLILVPLGILLVIRLIPPGIMAEHRDLAAAARERPVTRVTVLVIVMRSIVRIARAPLLQIMVSRIGLAFPGRLQQKEPLWLGMSALGQ